MSLSTSGLVKSVRATSSASRWRVRSTNSHILSISIDVRRRLIPSFPPISNVVQGSGNRINRSWILFSIRSVIAFSLCKGDGVHNSAARSHVSIVARRKRRRRALRPPIGRDLLRSAPVERPFHQPTEYDRRPHDRRLRPHRRKTRCPEPLLRSLAGSATA